MATARQGFKPTVELRAAIVLGDKAVIAAEKTQKAAAAEPGILTSSALVLASFPEEAKRDPDLLKAHIAETRAAEGRKDKKDRANLSELWKLGEMAERNPGDATVLAAALEAAQVAAAEELVRQNTALAKVRSDTAASKAQLKVYTDNLSASELKLFEKDRSAAAARVIDKDLVDLKKKLATFPPAPPTALVPCPARAALATFIADLENEVDAIAHYAPCHKCQTRNGVARTAEAKQLIHDKVRALETLASRPNADGLNPTEQADYALAKSLERMRTTGDDLGNVGGKMLGVLICSNDGGATTFNVYGYSGTLPTPNLPDDESVENATTGGWVRSIPPTGSLRNRANDAVTLESLQVGHDGTPHGVCSAPKMIQAALAGGYTIVAMAEAWYGAGANPHNELVASCATCMKNIGFQMCASAHG